MSGLFSTTKMGKAEQKNIINYKKILNKLGKKIFYSCLKVSNLTVLISVIGSYYDRANKVLSVGALA
jgi:hypothetical protein